MKPGMVVFGVVLSAAYIAFAGWVFYLGRRRRAGDKPPVSWSVRVLTMSAFLACYVAGVILLLLKESLARDQIVNVLLLQDASASTALPRYGLVVAYLVFLFGALYPQSRVR